MKKLLSLLLLIIAVTSCNQVSTPDKSLETLATDTSLSQGEAPRPDGVAETSSKLIADYVMSDFGLVEYDYAAGAAAGLAPSEVQGVLLTSEIDTSFEAVKATLDQANAAELSSELSNSGELATMASGTLCSILRDGCFYLVESKKTDPFNAVWSRVYLPSRAKGEIKIEEDNFAACAGNRTSKVEVPYIFSGGHSKGLRYQNIDAGLVWQCGRDNWALLMNTSNSGLLYSSAYRLPAGQEVRMTFYVASLSTGDRPRLTVSGNFIRSNGTRYTGSLRYTCASSSCGGGKWSRDGVDQNFKMEVNLAQGDYRNGKFYPGRIPRSGAVFNNTQIRGQYLGKLLYRSSTKNYYWSGASKWNIAATKATSSLTGVQCVTPSNNYSISGVANSGTATGAKININVRY